MAKTKKKTEGCNCIQSVNEQLKDSGYELETRMAMNFDTGSIKTIGPVLAVQKRDGVKRAKQKPTVLCSYCPVCGKKSQQ